MVKYKYIGRTTYQKGKTLWEIIGNLRDYGAGRLVFRQTFSHFPEPSFYKIVKAEAYPETERAPDRYRKSIVWVEEVFRGVRYPQIKEIHRVSYKPDYQLVPKDEEYLWYDKVATVPKRIPTIPPTHVDVPPVLKLILNEERKSKGQPVEEDMLAETVVVQNKGTKLYLESLKERPEKVVLRGFGKSEKAQSLYADIEAYKIHFLNENKSE